MVVTHLSQLFSFNTQMTQQKLMKTLEKTKKWMSSKELSKLVDSSRGCVAAGLKTMYKFDEVKRKKGINEWYNNIFLWKAK